VSAALARYANPGAELGHAGDRAPVHADARLEFAADLPRLPDSGPRAQILQRDADRLERTRQMLCDALEDLLQAHASIRGNDDRAVVAARRALTLGRLA
jgi:hypothetical protein